MQGDQRRRIVRSLHRRKLQNFAMFFVVDQPGTKDIIFKLCFQSIAPRSINHHFKKNYFHIFFIGFNILIHTICTQCIALIMQIRCTALYFFKKLLQLNLLHFGTESLLFTGRLFYGFYGLRTGHTKRLRLLLQSASRRNCFLRFSILFSRQYECIEICEIITRFIGYDEKIARVVETFHSHRCAQLASRMEKTINHFRIIALIG